MQKAYEATMKTLNLIKVDNKEFLIKELKFGSKTGIQIQTLETFLTAMIESHPSVG